MRTILALTGSMLLASLGTLTSSSAAFPPPDADAAHPPALPAPKGKNLSGWRLDADRMAVRGLDWLKSQQDKESGGWGVSKQAPTFPAVTGLVLSAMIEQAQRQGWEDPLKKPEIAAAVKFILSKQQPDGGIYDKLLPSYNTAICATALARVNTPEAKAAVARAADFLKAIQYSEGVVITDNPDQGQKVDASHPYYGGWGYGNHGRPDISNTAFAIEALHAAGVPENDVAYQRALVFLKRLQMDGSVNDMDYAKGSKQGGFIYAAGTSKDDAGAGLSYSAGNIEETLDNGEKISRMRAYGSVTYAGFKSLIYAGLKKDDPRVLAAMRWISQNYSVKENPGMGPAGQYYYYLAMARALDAVGVDTLAIATGSTTSQATWGEDLTNQLKTLQSAEGSFTSLNKRWMEDNQVLITAYSVLALQAASHQR